MAITLGDLRTFAAEIASADISSAAGDREIQHWINNAIQRVWSESDWSWANSEARIALEFSESGSAMDLTSQSRVITLTGEVFKAKYLSDRWQLHVTGEGNMTLELESIQSPTSATLKPGHEWAAATSTTTAYVWSRHIYPLPLNAKQVKRCQDMQNRFDLTGLSPSAFDQARQQTPTQRGNVPLFYTVRQGNIEFWPGPNSTTYRTMYLSIRRGPTIHLTDAPAGDTVDWPEEWNDLLHKAIILEASITQGKNAVVDYPIALREYEERLKIYKAEDGNIQDLGGPMHLTSPMFYRDYTRYTDYPSSLPSQG